MHCSPYLPVDYGPVSYMQETVFQYLKTTKYYNRDLEYLSLHKRNQLLNALKSSEEFLKFWTYIQLQHPSRRDYFSSLVNEDEPYDSEWIEDKYREYHLQTAFEALSEEEQRIVQNEFDVFRPTEYRVALEAESKRLNCDITDVMPLSTVLPREPDHDEESVLARLPDQLFGRVFQFLETIDIFRMTLVCKRWKRMVFDNSKELKKAEHAMTTHSIRCTDWMDPSKTPNGEAFLNQYQMFSLCLTRWFCGISENLETLILDISIPYTNVANLLQLCPNLKHLRIGYDGDWNDSLPDTVLARVELRKLEVFMSSSLIYYLECRRLCRQLYRDILIFSPSLRVYQGPLDSADLGAIDVRNPVSYIFSKLVVLDLANFTATSIEILAHIDGLQLKYLRLGDQDHYSEADGAPNEDRARNALHKLLPKLKKLEMLRTSDFVGVTNDTIQLMIDLKMNINWAVLYHSYVSMDFHEVGVIPPMEKDPLQPEVLDAFRNMLLSKNPNIDLSEIRLVMHEGKTVEALKAMNTGFMIIQRDAWGNPTIPVDELYDPKIKQRLDLDVELLF